MKCLAFILFYLLTSTAMADVLSVTYHLGKIIVEESDDKIILHTSPKITIAILDGGKTWPAFALDENGKIYAGNMIIDPDSGVAITHPKTMLAFPYSLKIADAADGFRFQQFGYSCYLSTRQLGLDRRQLKLVTLVNSNIIFANAPDALFALVMQFGKNGKVKNYVVEKINLENCQIIERHDIGNPDLLVELNHSIQGGWWITGSIEQTLLQSNDGIHWRSISLPKDLSSLISAYIANPEEIWLAAILPSEETESPYLLVYSSDGGKSWRNVVANDPVLQRLPPGWLEGQKRRVLQ